MILSMNNNAVFIMHKIVFIPVNNHKIENKATEDKHALFPINQFLKLAINARF